MPTQVYRTADGKRVPSVTTICSRFKDSGGLIHWAWKLAYEPLMEARALMQNGRNFTAFLAADPANYDYRQVREKAADAGTIAHAMVECFIRGRVFDPGAYNPALVELACPAYEAFLAWALQSKLQIIDTERPLVSEKHRFGGTRDAILVDGRRSVGDWKSSNDIYPEYLVQLAAYGILDEEDGNTIDGGYHLLRFSKQSEPTDPVHFTHHYWSQLDPAREAFLAMRGLYDTMKRLEKLAA